MCSWVHRESGRPAVSLVCFEPKRPTKNIVYYADRMRELEGAPSLAFHSPHKVATVQVLYKEVGAGAANAAALDIAAERLCETLADNAVDELAAVHAQPVVQARQARKRQASAVTVSALKKQVRAAAKGGRLEEADVGVC